MIQQHVCTIVDVHKDELKFCNSRTLSITVTSPSGETTVRMSSTPATPYSQDFEWFWKNVSSGVLCTLVKNEGFFEASLLPPR